MDDVLAAVDSHVARHVFGECSMFHGATCVYRASPPTSPDHVIGPYGLLATKGRIVVTNSIAFLKHFDKLVYLRRGVIVEQGSYEDLVNNSESQLHKLM